MFSNQRPNDRRRPPGFQQTPEGAVRETTLLRKEIQIERKEFSLALKQNARGRFIRVVESNGNHFASIIIPTNGLTDFQKLLGDMIRADKQVPPNGGNPPPT
jgi:hypothetical protein